MLRFLIYLSVSLMLQFGVSEHTTANSCSSKPIYQKTDAFSDISKSALDLADHFGPENVLLVFDIDNTLLAMNQEVGSDQWFAWQAKLLEHDPNNENLIAIKFSELLESQRLIYSIASMSQTEAKQSTLLKALSDKGFPRVLLTSRGPEMRDSTVRELNQSQYKLSANTPFRDVDGSYYPYDFNDMIDAYKSDPNVLEQFRLLTNHQDCKLQSLHSTECLRTARKVSFHKGLYLTSGQNKGLMLSLLMNDNKTISKQIKAIIFADDTPKHIQDMYYQFCQSNIQLSLFHYTHEDKRVEQFSHSNKKNLVQRWNTLKEAIRAFQ